MRAKGAGKGEGRTAVVLLIAGFLTVVLAMVALGTKYFPTSGTEGDGRVFPSRRPGQGLEPSLADLRVVDHSRSLLRASAGGTIEAPGDLALLEIPPAALPADTEVQISRVLIDHPRDLTGMAIDLLPDRLTLRQPARLVVPIPAGADPAQLELVVYDPSTKRWLAEPTQRLGDDRRSLQAEITHFSLRRIRIRPGMKFPSQLPTAGAAPRFEADASGYFERYIAGRWQAVPHAAASYRELVALGRAGRAALIRSGRLRAVAAPHAGAALWRDHEVLAALPGGAEVARTGWVRIERLDRDGNPTGPVVIAAVRGAGPTDPERHAGIGVYLSRGALEQLGLRFGVDFGVEVDRPERSFIALEVEPDGPRSESLAIRVTSAPAPLPSAP